MRGRPIRRDARHPGRRARRVPRDHGARPTRPEDEPSHHRHERAAVLQRSARRDGALHEGHRVSDGVELAAAPSAGTSSRSLACVMLSLFGRTIVLFGDTFFNAVLNDMAGACPRAMQRIEGADGALVRSGFRTTSSTGNSRARRCPRGRWCSSRCRSRRVHGSAVLVRRDRGDTAGNGAGFRR